MTNIKQTTLIFELFVLNDKHLADYTTIWTICIEWQTFIRLH